jgi:hypothetical protein
MEKYYDPFLMEAICRLKVVFDETAVSGILTKRFIALMKNFANKVMESPLQYIFIPPHLAILDSLEVQSKEGMCSPLIGLTINVYTESQQECWDKEKIVLPTDKQYWVLGVTKSGAGFLGAF